MKIEEVIQKPLITEKSTQQKENANEYFFKVHVKASKPLIRKAVEALFKVEVTRVHTMHKLGKLKRVGRFMGRSSNWKKAIVTLKQGDTIKIFEGT